MSTASLMPELLETLGGTLTTLLRSHLDLLSGRSLATAIALHPDASEHDAGSPAAPLTTIPTSSVVAPSRTARPAAAGQGSGQQDGAVACDTAPDAAVECMRGLAGVAAVMSKTSAGCDVLFTAPGAPCLVPRIRNGHACALIRDESVVHVRCRAWDSAVHGSVEVALCSDSVFLQ